MASSDQKSLEVQRPPATIQRLVDLHQRMISNSSATSGASFSYRVPDPRRGRESLEHWKDLKELIFG